MDTKQKLTLGIAAIFMVTLTIVGVTYAYFVTRVVNEGDPAGVEVSTANVGSVEYQAGNGDSDIVTLNDVLPGTTVYKSFKVFNNSEDETLSSTYNIYMSATTTEGAAQYVHATATTDCYNSSAVQSNKEGYTASCFDTTSYNNVKATLYEVDINVFNTVDNDGNITDASALTSVVKTTNVPALAGVEAGTTNLDLANNLTILGQATKYYVLKVEYLDTDSNQNIENDAALSIKVSIK